MLPLPMDRQPCVYILASQRRGTLYIGVTANLARRLFEHRNGATQGFTERYGVHHLVHVDQCATMPLAIAREKPGSCGQTECSAQTSGRAGDVASLPSLLASTPGLG